MESETASTDSPRQYGDVAAVYDALMANVSHAAWLSRIEKAVRARGKSPRSALDVACGTGIVTELLHRRGYYPVVGADISPAMVAIARTKASAKNYPITYAQQDAATLDLGAEAKFELAVSLFDSLNYILEPERLQSAFRRVFAHLVPGGLFAFDLNAIYALANDFFTQTNRVGPVRHVWKSHWDRETRLCRVEMEFWVTDGETGEVRHFTELHLQRGYTVPEILQWLSDAGFTQIEVFGNYSDRPPVAQSDRLLFVAERPA